MKLSVALALGAAFFTGVQAIVVGENGELFRRECTATSCSCKDVDDGLFCGDGRYNCKLGFVYQCGGNGKLSCEYGQRYSCKECGRINCP